MFNIVDIFIPLAFVNAAYVGRHRGTVRQSSALMGVIVGVFAAAYLYSLLSFLTESSLIRAVVLTLVLFAISFLSYDIFDTLGKRFQKHALFHRLHDTIYDKIASAGVSGMIAVVIIWFGATLLGGVLPSVARTQLKKSQILATTQGIQLPFISNVAKLLEPFSSPDVFATNEPNFDVNALPIPERYGELDKAISRVKSSMVKVATQGCGSIGSGSGFMIGKSLIMTNAHVIAGAERMAAEYGDTSYVIKAVWFDPQLDVAILSTNSELPGSPLVLTDKELPPGTIGAILGYPGGESLVASDIVILQKLQAEGYDIYQKQMVKRDIYVARSSIKAGNSGGPLIDASGNVAGLVVGHSTADERVGFIMSATMIRDIAKKAHELRDTVSTGSCANIATM